MGGLPPARDPVDFLRHPKEFLKHPKRIFADEPEPIPPPEPLPTPSTELFTEAGEFEKKKSRKRRGRRQTIVTGDLAPASSKRTLLG